MPYFKSGTLVNIISIITFLMLIVFSEYVVNIESRRNQESLRSYIGAQASAVRARLEGEMNSTLYLANGIGGYASAHVTLDEEPLSIVLKTVYSYGRHLRNIGVAPDNVLTYTYPIKGNEKAIGLKYEDSPQQWPAVKRAIDTATPILAGPVQLVQGGNGLISRTPVYLPDNQYWGIVSLVMDSDALFESAGLLDNSGDVVYALRGKDGLGAAGEMILGNQRIFDAWSLRYLIPIPGGSWELAAAPLNGWDADSSYLIIFRLSGIAISTLISILVYFVLSNSQRIQKLALHDFLTELPNRRLLCERLNNAIVKASRSKSDLFLLTIDLDDFKQINDNYGHSAGDKVLKTLAARFKSVIHSSDTVSRVGGDEFIMLLTEINEQEKAVRLAEFILDQINEPIYYGKEKIFMKASIGLSRYPKHGASTEELLHFSDHAMYEAKKKGKGQFFAL